MHDHPAHRVAGPGPARVAAGDPLVEVLAGITAVALQRDDAQPDVGRSLALGEQPRVPAGRDVVPELQIDGVGIEIDTVQHVLRARFHIARGDSGVEPSPPAHHRLHAVRSNHHAGPDRLLPTRGPQAHRPAAVRGPVHPHRLGRHVNRDALGRRLRRQRGVETRAIENPGDVRPRDLHLGVIGREDDDAGDFAGGPWGAVGIGELAQARVADAFGAAHRRADEGIAFDEEDIQLGRGALGLRRGHAARGACAHDENVVVRHSRPSRARRRDTARCTCGSRYRCGGRSAGPGSRGGSLRVGTAAGITRSDRTRRGRRRRPRRGACARAGGAPWGEG